MNNQTDAYVFVRNIAVMHLKGTKSRSEADIVTAVQRAISAAKIFGCTDNFDSGQLASELLHLFSISAEKGTALDDARDHIAWLPSKRGSIQWRYWPRYGTFLETDFGMPPDVIGNLNELTDMVLERLEDPARPAPWDRRGMVVGSVQSGKTANYTGLINKAVDVGYKLVIVLAGLHSNLRSQTQLRIDEGVLGFDTQKNRKLNQDNRWVGVGQLPGERLHIHSLTSSAEDGDFNRNIAENIGVMIGSDPVVLVIKKNGHILKNLLKWVTHVAGVDDPNLGRRMVKNIPLLLIDDEADNGSINVKDNKSGSNGENSVSAINGKIREILASFDKVAYVGYTATPFANIFVNPDAHTQKHGDDIFPRSFIINVKAPTNYIGPEKLFGLVGDADAAIEAKNGLPIVRYIEDKEILDIGTFPLGHNKDHVPERLPKSLKIAIRCFILASAARRARGQGKGHCSMLIHVTRFVDVQGRVTELVKSEVSALMRRISDGDGMRTPTIIQELKSLWQSDFVPTTAALGQDAGRPVTWSQVCCELHEAASRIAVLPINGLAKEALDYKEHEAHGRSVIAVGGDKLSRGLTLEGLCVSYFLRTTRMYDTLMQMGRWFGYRPGYLDLCRIYTTKGLTHWYRHIALAEAELRREFDYMVRAGLSPESYGLRVRTHPDGMIITAMNKMFHSQRRELSWSGVLVQTTQMPKGPRIISNAITTEGFLKLLPGIPTQRENGSVTWTDIRPEVVANYLAKMEYPPESARANGEDLAHFVRAQQAQGELTNWTVVLISNTKVPPADCRTFAGRPVGLLVRNPASQTANDYALRNANIYSPADESIDLASLYLDTDMAAQLLNKPALDPDRDFILEQAARIPPCDLRSIALALTRRRAAAANDPNDAKLVPKLPNGRVIRELRPKTHALLLIYPLQQPDEVPEERKDDILVAPAEKTGLDPLGDPVIGLALSFPESETAVRVEYQLNKVGKKLAESINEDLFDDN
jgi:hypothetical protein